MPRFALPAIVLLSYPLLMGGCIADFLEGDRGTVNVVITDAPADNVDRVRLSISAIELRSDDRGTERFDLSPSVVISDLLALQGGVTRELMTEDEIPDGTWNAVRLYIDGGSGNSLVREDAGGEFELFTPGQSDDLSGPSWIEASAVFRVRDDETTRLVLDLDLRRGLVKASDDSHYILLPAARLVERSSAASVTGTVVSADLTDASCTNDLAADKGNAVYAYVGSAVSAGDIFLDSAARALGGNNPVAVTPVTQNSGGDYVYSLAFLPPGDYTLALTCQSLNDAPLQDDAIGFLSSKNITLDGGARTVDF